MKDIMKTMVEVLGIFGVVTKEMTQSLAGESIDDMLQEVDWKDGYRGGTEQSLDKLM